jgi:hypothetical protein
MIKPHEVMQGPYNIWKPACSDLSWNWTCINEEPEACHSSLEFQSIACLRPLEYLDRGFQSDSSQGCFYVFLLFVLSCLQVVAFRWAESPRPNSASYCV